MFYIMYKKEDGQIKQTLNSGGTFKGSQLQEFEDNGIGLITLPDGVQTHGKRVNLDTLELEDCPIFAENLRKGEILRQLAELDAKRDRALAEAFLTGDKTWLQKHIDAQAALRKLL